MTDILKQLKNERLIEGCVSLCDDAAEEIERLRRALFGLNAAVDDYWNGRRTDGAVKNICYWQFKAKEALEYWGGVESRHAVVARPEAPASPASQVTGAGVAPGPQGRQPYDGRPFYCQSCGAGFGEYLACDEPQCELETSQQAEARKAHALTSQTQRSEAT